MKKILFIDDEANSDKMASKFEILEAEGVQVLSVSRVDEVMPLLRKYESEIGLIVLDIIMAPFDYYTLDETEGGTKTGIRLLTDIRADFKDIPILILSITKRQSLSSIIETTPGIRFLQKPYLITDLLREIRRFIS